MENTRAKGRKTEESMAGLRRVNVSLSGLSTDEACVSCQLSIKDERGEVRSGGSEPGASFSYLLHTY
eukprot:scaffold194081_cov81-Cyclotella_meneghiniana.AAC.2